MLKKYRFLIAFLTVAAGIIAVAQGCGSSTPTASTSPTIQAGFP